MPTEATHDLVAQDLDSSTFREVDVPFQQSLELRHSLSPAQTPGRSKDSISIVHIEFGTDHSADEPASNLPDMQ